MEVERTIFHHYISLLYPLHSCFKSKANQFFEHLSMSSEDDEWQMSRGINMNIFISYGSIYEEIILQTWWWSREKNDNGRSSQMFSFMMILKYSKLSYKNGLFFWFQSYCLMSMIWLVCRVDSFPLSYSIFIEYDYKLLQSRHQKIMSL
jgi:hypothetical protein